MGGASSVLLSGWAPFLRAIAVWEVSRRSLAFWTGREGSSPVLQAPGEALSYCLLATGALISSMALRILAGLMGATVMLDSSVKSAAEAAFVATSKQQGQAPSISFLCVPDPPDATPDDK
jgi:hypothetical protein